MRTGTKTDERPSKTPGFSDIVRVRKDPSRMIPRSDGHVDAVKDVEKRGVEAVKGDVDGEKVILSNSSSSSSSHSQSSGYNSSGTPTPGALSSSVLKPVSVLRPNRPSAERDVRPEPWRKQVLGSAISSGDSVPDGDENAFPALPNKVVRPDVTLKASSKRAPNLVDQGVSAAPPKTATLATPPVDYHKKLSPVPKMTDCVKIVDESFQWRGDDPAVLSRCGALLDATDFLVVGVVGPQGAGKSTLMSRLADVKRHDRTAPQIFRVQTEELISNGVHRTSGVDMYVASTIGGPGYGAERLILLDTQPLFSVSVLDGFVVHERKYPPDFATAENCVLMQSIHMLAWLLTVSHVVLVVQDWFMDLEVMKSLLTAEMLKPSLTPPSNPDGTTRDEARALSTQPTLIFVQTKASNEEMTRASVAEMRRDVAALLADSGLNYRGAVAGKFGSKGVGPERTKEELEVESGLLTDDVNLFLLPDLSLGGSPAHLDRNYDQEVRSLKKRLLGLRHRPALFGSGTKVGNAISEKTWMRQAGKVWEGMKKASLMLEYNRLLT